MSIIQSNRKTVAEIDSEHTSRKYGWRRAVIIVLTFFAVFLTALLGFKSYLETKEMNMEKYALQSCALARSAAAGLEAYLQEVQTLVMTAASDFAILSMNHDCHHAMEALSRGFIPRTSIRCIDADGKLRFIYPADDWRKSLVGTSYNSDSLFKEVQEKSPISVTGVVFNERNEPRLRIAVPLYSGEKNGTGQDSFRGILAVSFDIEILANIFFTSGKSSSNFEFWLIDQDGRLLFHPHTALIGKYAFEQDTGSPLHANIAGEKFRTALISEKEGTFYCIPEAEAGNSGKEVFLAYAPVKLVDQIWAVATVTPVKEVGRTVTASSLMWLFISALVIAILTGGCALVIRSQHRFFYRLEKEIEKRTEELEKSGKYLNSLITRAHQPTAVLNPRGKITVFNEAFQKVTGRKETDMIGKHITILFAGKDGEQNGRDTESSPGNKRTLMTADGRTRIGLWHCTPIYARDERTLIATIIQYEDITDQRNYQIKLWESEDRFRKIFEGGALGIATLTLDGRFDQVNAALGRMLECGEEELKGKTYLEITHPDDRERDLHQVERLLKREILFYKTEKRYVTKNGRIRWGHVIVSVIRDEEESARYFLAMIEDISKKKLAEEDRKKLESQLLHAQKMEALGILVAGVAHEINNPVNKIMFDIPLLQNVWKDVMCDLTEEKNTKMKKYGGLTITFLQENLPRLLSDMEMAASRIIKITNDLKNFSRKSSISDKKPLLVTCAIENVIRLIEPTLRKSHIRLSLDLANDVPLIEANLNSIEQVVMNIVINASQAINHDHGIITIASSFSEADHRVSINISDNGRGIDPAIKQIIYDPFVTTRQPEGGIGLGLAIAYNIVRAHGGDISSYANEKEGTTFTISFPPMNADGFAKNPEFAIRTVS
ncbi:MAG: PAS domain S-box protein [Syntrophales bacterium]|jgi:PAS domain S-box-containing protein|nr:PAS domain S-box protein [Syntrophales bacterium]MDY0043641.1 PAS domain S-box protein [Syntrophales bacterium]